MSDRVELDRLADYAAGLLDGTPDGAEVARLVVGDSAWAQAYAELLAADRRVRDDLGALGAVPEPMPVDVAARLTAALDAAALDGPGPDEHGREPSAGRRTVVSLAAARRRRRAWAGLAAAAAGVVAFAAFGLPALRPAVTDVGSTSADALHGEAERGQGDRGEAPAAGAAEVVLRASGVDYRRDALRFGDDPWAASQSAGGFDAPSAASGGASALDSALPVELRRFVDPAARDACLAAVTATYGDRPASVDFARFEGAPALIVRMVDANGKPSRIVVAGPACGQSGAGADVRYTVTAG